MRIAFYPRSDSTETTTNIIITGQFGKVVERLATQSNFGEVHFTRASYVASHLSEGTPGPQAWNKTRSASHMQNDHNPCLSLREKTHRQLR